MIEGGKTYVGENHYRTADYWVSEGENLPEGCGTALSKNAEGGKSIFREVKISLV
jgi:hypothetical protein